MNSKNLFKNALSSVATYGLLLLFNMYVSKVFLFNYGSEANGLVSSVNQIFSYLALLEAGIGTATINALYGPLAAKDNLKINDIICASRNYYRISSIWYFIGVAAISFIWPLLIDSTLPFFTIWALIFIHGISSIISFCFTATISNYLIASGKNYANNAMHIISTVLTYVLKIIICSLNLSIVYVSVSLVLVNIVRCIFYSLYFKKAFPDFKKSKKPNRLLLKQRTSFLIHEISGVIFSSTDVIIISVFCSLNEASVYAIYSLVTVALNSIIGQVVNGTSFYLGNKYSANKETYSQFHDLYNTLFIFGIFVIYTTAYALILPFITLYTSGLSDAMYSDRSLPILFVLIQILSMCRSTDNTLIKISLHAKQTISRTIIEAAINLISSVVLVQFMGMKGVLFGTIFALVYRTNDIIIYANKKILNRSPLKEYKLYLSNFAVFALLTVVLRNSAITATSYFSLIFWAVAIFLSSLIIYAVLNISLNFKMLKPVFKMFMWRLKHR